MITSKNILISSLTFGLTLYILYEMFSMFYKPQLNPFISLSYMFLKKMSFKESMIYICFQLIGSFIGSLFIALFMGSFSYLGSNEISDLLLINYNFASASIVAIIIESLLTFIFILSLLILSNNKNSNFYLSLIYFVLILIGAPFTATSIDFARSLSTSLLQTLSDNYNALSQLYIFFIGPLIGSVLAVFAFKSLNKVYAYE
ncbi:MAG: aquaporin [Erysipelotrichaceae bacterium]|nr:aquaporin [Erysipelotrichaceae bacterium]